MPWCVGNAPVLHQQNDPPSYLRCWAEWATLRTCRLKDIIATREAVPHPVGVELCCDLRYQLPRRITEIYEGTSEIQHLVIAGAMLKEYSYDTTMR